MKNPKSEYRNSKQIPNSKLQIQKGLVGNIGILHLLCLFRISCLEFRISFNPLTEDLSCQLAHNFIDKRLIGLPSFLLAPYALGLCLFEVDKIALMGYTWIVSSLLHYCHRLRGGSKLTSVKKPAGFSSRVK